MNIAATPDLKERLTTEMELFIIFIEQWVNPGYVNFLLEANKLLSQRSDYVGLAPYGSQLNGTASVMSDFNVIVICGDTQIATHESILKDLNVMTKEKFAQKTGNALIFSEDYFKSNFDLHESSNLSYSHVAWILAYPFIGNDGAIKNLRNLLRIRHLNCQDRWCAIQNLSQTIKTLMYFESDAKKSAKRAERLEAHPPIRLEARHRREDFWNKRVFELFAEPSP